MPLTPAFVFQQTPRLRPDLVVSRFIQLRRKSAFTKRPPQSLHIVLVVGQFSPLFGDRGNHILALHLGHCFRARSLVLRESYLLVDSVARFHSLGLGRVGCLRNPRQPSGDHEGYFALLNSAPDNLLSELVGELVGWLVGALANGLVDGLVGGQVNGLVGGW